MADLETKVTLEYTISKIPTITYSTAYNLCLALQNFHVVTKQKIWKSDGSTVSVYCLQHSTFPFYFYIDFETTAGSVSRVTLYCLDSSIDTIPIMQSSSTCLLGVRLDVSLDVYIYKISPNVYLFSNLLMYNSVVKGVGKGYTLIILEQAVYNQSVIFTKDSFETSGSTVPTMRTTVLPSTYNKSTNNIELIPLMLGRATTHLFCGSGGNIYYPNVFQPPEKNYSNGKLSTPLYYNVNGVRYFVLVLGTKTVAFIKV